MRKSFFLALALFAFGAGVAIPQATHAATTAAIEYYDANLNHYFITAAQDEVVALNSGRFFGWIATGLSVPVLSSDATDPGSTPVCRFYGNPDAGLDSHFYSADPAECAMVLERFPGIWVLESSNVFRAYLPDAATGACPAGTKPIYRLWNQRADVNHRYTDRIDIALAMQGIGYVSEGYGPGPTPPALCSPSSTMACTVTVSNPAPLMGSNVTLTAACSGNPTRFSWAGCASSTNTCVATSPAAGPKSYAVTASSPVAISSPVATTVSWQSADAADEVVCQLTTSNAIPVVGSNVLLTAVCKGDPTSYAWVGCASSTDTCVATSATPGAKTYSVSASNGISTSPSVATSVNWQATAPPSGISCALSTSNTAPPVGSTITLTAACTGNPTGYAWVGCTSSTNTCVATSASPGSRSYSVSASDGITTSIPAGITVNWQSVAGPPAPPAGISCALAASNTAPVVGSTVTLSAVCTGNPAIYTWTGCASSTSTCSATSATVGSRNYAVTATNGAATSAPASTSVYWQGVPPAGMPTSADYLPKAQDPRANQPYGSSAGFSSMKRMANGQMIVFGMSHTPTENNAVETYDPVTNSWTVRIPHTAAAWPAAGVTGRTFLGNRDNQVSLMIRPLNQYWAMEGERGYDIVGNYRGVVDTANWNWKYIDDNRVFQPSGDDPIKVWDGVGEWIDALNVGVIYGGISGQPGDTLQVFTLTGSSPAFKRTAWSNPWGTETFPGSMLLRYISQSNWIRGDKIHIYGGVQQDRNTNVNTPNATIYELDVTAVPNGGQPVMRPVSTNTLPPNQQVNGDAILGDLWPSKDMAVLTDGRKINVYDYASGSWVYVAINNPPGDSANSPNSEGSGAQGRWAPEIDQLIVLGQNGATFGVRLNFGGPPPPPPPASVSCTLAASNTAPVVGSSVTLTASCTGNPTSYMWINCTSVATACIATSLSAGAVTYSVTATNGVSTSSPAAVTVNWQQAAGPPPPPPPPPPPANAGNRTVTATAVPLAGPSWVLGASKQLDFARLNGRWYKAAGDHAQLDGNVGGMPTAVPVIVQGGRQEILSFTVPANDWREDQPYYVPDSTKVQATDPDDAFLIPRGGEIWYFFSDTNHPIAQPPGNYAQQIQPNSKLMAWTPPPQGGPYGTWRVVNNWPWIIGGDRAWRGFYDPVKDRFVIPITSSGSLVWGLIDGATGNDLTQYVAGVPRTYGDHVFSVAGVAPDFTQRKFYMYDVYTSELWQADMDTLALIKVANLPEPAQGTQAAIKMTWHPDLRAVVLAATKIQIYEVDSGKLSTVARPDSFVNGAGNYVPTSTVFFDPDTRDVISIGTMDWDTSINPGKYWRLKIQ
jgi:hypothetical protein